jgi:phosphoglycolate phosphatase-like HAD superfamily hydrolase
VLLRLVLLRRLASSLPAFRATLERYRAFAAIAAQAATAGRRLEAAEFQRLFPRAESADVQLTLLPLLLEPGESSRFPADGLDDLRTGAHAECDPKAEALERLLAARGGKTIVFTDARETARYLLRHLGRRFRVAAVAGGTGWFGATGAPAAEVLAAFAPRAQGGGAVPEALRTDILVATDLVSEGLNLQDAARVIHYDLPWSPARLAQRVGRIDRLGSPHQRIETAALLPPPELAAALDVEDRLSAKLLAQYHSGAAQRETPEGPDGAGAAFDWCDRLQALACVAGEAEWAQAEGRAPGAVLVVRVGGYAEAIVVDGDRASAAPERATRLLEPAACAPAREPDRAAFDAAVRLAAPVIRARVAAVERARWRAEDRDRLARRLIPWVLTAARRAARVGDAALLGRLDRLVSRLTLGMTAGEELALHALLERRASLAIRDLLAWHERLPPVTPPPDAPEIELVAAVVMAP